MVIERSVLISNDSKFVIIRRNSIFGKKISVRIFHTDGVDTFVVLDEDVISKLPESNLENICDNNPFNMNWNSFSFLYNKKTTLLRGFYISMKFFN